MVFPGPGEREGGLVGETRLTTTTTTEKPPRKVYPERKARVRGHRTGKVRVESQITKKSNPTCTDASLCLCFLICIIGKSSQGSYDSKVN